MDVLSMFQAAEEIGKDRFDPLLESIPVLGLKGEQAPHSVKGIEDVVPSVLGMKGRIEVFRNDVPSAVLTMDLLQRAFPGSNILRRAAFSISPPSRKELGLVVWGAGAAWTGAAGTPPPRTLSRVHTDSADPGTDFPNMDSSAAKGLDALRNKPSVKALAASLGVSCNRGSAFGKAGFSTAGLVW